jgi:hypothetical protein
LAKLHSAGLPVHSPTAVIAVLGVWGGRQLIGLPYPLLAGGAGDHIIGLAGACLGGWWVGDRVARWYIAETAGWNQG